MRTVLTVPTQAYRRSKYYTQDIWFAFEVINGIEQRAPIVGERVVTYFYSDSNRSRLIDRTSSEVFLRGAGQP